MIMLPIFGQFKAKYSSHYSGQLVLTQSIELTLIQSTMHIFLPVGEPEAPAKFATPITENGCPTKMTGDSSAILAFVSNGPSLLYKLTTALCSSSAFPPHGSRSGRSRGWGVWLSVAGTWLDRTGQLPKVHIQHSSSNYYTGKQNSILKLLSNKHACEGEKYWDIILHRQHPRHSK